LNDHAVLSLDWPKQIQEDDEYISVARRVLYLDVAPAIGRLLDSYNKPLAGEVGLNEWTVASRRTAAARSAAAHQPFQKEQGNGTARPAQAEVPVDGGISKIG
jgi:hypothetical protein